MNLLSDKWLPVIRRDKNGNKSEDTISIYEITSDIIDNPVIDIISPRLDIKNALYQFFIGLLQVTNTPQNSDVWLKNWDNPPDTYDLQKKMYPLFSYFEIDSNGPAFMQDFDLKEGEEKPIAALFIESPGAKTIKDNLDHFTKRDLIQALDPYWAAAALYTLQSFAPSGGVGHRVGVRGGGPLTTILLPRDTQKRVANLWEKLWINVLPHNDIITTCKSSNHETTDFKDIFPWLKPTKVSDAEGSELYPQQCHPLHVYFAMPRRIRLVFSNESGICSLTGKKSNKIVTGFFTKNYGNNYSGTWIHPLNAYRLDLKKPEQPPLSIKGQPGGVHYRYWLSLTIGSDDGTIPSSVVKSLENDFQKRLCLKSRGTQVWAAGYDMDNMKARSWHDSTIPYYFISPSKIPEFSGYIESLLSAAYDIASVLKSSVKKIWAVEKADMSFLDDAFLQNTERYFYENINLLINNIEGDIKETIKVVGKNWITTVQKEARSLFEKWCLNTQEGQKNLHKVFEIRRDFDNLIHNIKSVKNIRAWYEDINVNEKKAKNKKQPKKEGSN